MIKKLLVASAVALVSMTANAAPYDMTLAEFTQFVQGQYKPTNPEFTSSYAYVNISEKNGVLTLEHRLNVGTKNSTAVYEMTGFQCDQFVPGDNYPNYCHMMLKMIDMGGNVHFIGVTPYVRINRTPTSLENIEIKNDIDQIDGRPLVITLEKNLGELL